jgi:hypothetical protein
MPARRTPLRRPPLAVEQLEDRSVPSGIPFRFTLDDPQHQFDAFPALRGSLDAAGQILSRSLEGRGSLEVRVRPDNSIPRSEGGAVAVTLVGRGPGFDVLENGPVTEARTGVDPNGAAPDIDLAFNARDYLPTTWFDPSGAARTAAVPPGKIDFISAAMHETLHALGFQGYRTIDGPGYGGFPQPLRSTFDALTAFGAGGDPGVLYFVGPSAVARYGGPVPLTSVGPGHPLSTQNFFHVGNPPGRPGADLLPDLMNGMVFAFGKRYGVSELDRAMLADLGWGGAAPVSVPPAALAPLTGDVTGLVGVALSAPRFNRRSGRYRQVVTLRNGSGRTVQGPLTLVLAGPPGRRARDAGGWAAATRWFTIPVGELAPGEERTFALGIGPALGRRPRSVLRLLAGEAAPSRRAAGRFASGANPG